MSPPRRSPRPTRDGATVVTEPAGSQALASHVARLFFDRQLTKVEIAARLGISRYRVARLLDRALADGLVRIEFRDVPLEDRIVAGTIEATYGIDLCAVASPHEDEETDRAVAYLAGQVVGDLIAPGSVVGIAWGSTLASVVGEIPSRDDPSIEVVQLAGSSTRVARGGSPGEVARRLAERLGATYHPLHAPAFVETRELRDALLREPELAEAAALWSRLDLAVVGIGAFGPVRVDPASDGATEAGSRSSLLAERVLGASDLALLRAAGACGDLVLYPFDAAGTFVGGSLADRAVAIPLASLEAAPRLVAVAAGGGKAEAIRGALATGLVDVLVTDLAGAHALVDPAGNPRAGRALQATGRDRR